MFHQFFDPKPLAKFYQFFVQQYKKRTIPAFRNVKTKTYHFGQIPFCSNCPPPQPHYAKLIPAIPKQGLLVFPIMHTKQKDTCTHAEPAEA
jgi:hypothetical protein